MKAESPFVVKGQEASSSVIRKCEVDERPWAELCRAHRSPPIFLTLNERLSHILFMFMSINMTRPR